MVSTISLVVFCSIYYNFPYYAYFIVLYVLVYILKLYNGTLVPRLSNVVVVTRWRKPFKQSLTGGSGHAGRAPSGQARRSRRRSATKTRSWKGRATVTVTEDPTNLRLSSKDLKTCQKRKRSQLAKTLFQISFHEWLMTSFISGIWRHPCKRIS